MTNCETNCELSLCGDCLTFTSNSNPWAGIVAIELSVLRAPSVLSAKWFWNMRSVLDPSCRLQVTMSAGIRPGKPFSGLRIIHTWAMKQTNDNNQNDNKKVEYCLGSSAGDFNANNRTAAALVSATEAAMTPPKRY